MASSVKPLPATTYPTAAASSGLPEGTTDPRDTQERLALPGAQQSRSPRAEAEEPPPSTAQLGPRGPQACGLCFWSPVWSEGPDPIPRSYLSLDNLLWEVTHGVRQPAFQALGKVTNGLCQGAWEIETRY